ncbi:MAG: helix-turn-helix domain-containing protein [Fischerella sp.]|nr:helix-turn-helix domain-containing protein [Fischerella sp.]
MKGGSKYQPLLEYLQKNNSSEIILTFTEIEKLINNTLPDSARKERRWWGNRTTGSPQASAWMKAGYVVAEFDLDTETVTFRKPTSSYKVQTATNTINWNSETIKALRLQMGLSQKEFAEELGVRQQTVSEWETSVYEPTRATSKLLSMVAEKAGFKYKTGE